MKKMKIRTGGTRVLALLLVLTLLVGVLPAAVLATGASATADSGDDFHRILHLDCGRKYFSPAWIKALIHEMAAAGYNQLQLAFGNDGLRFLLDDMSFTANGTTYDHATVVSKVEAGNKAQNSSGDARWLTQSEMDEIIAEANKYGIEVVPLLNLPGHANAILDIVDDQYNASGSDNTLDVANNEAARNFGYAIFQKYLDYFAGKGCKYFNFGADEYANDASGTFSFSRLNSTQYQTFVTFINQLASLIKEAGMTPRAFNDGMYYNNQSASIDTSIQCCYWSSGWGSYPVAAASTIAGKGHEMINTNGDYYYVLGKNDNFDSGYTYATNFSNETFMGSTISSPAGSMFCIWCDYPNAETEQEVAQKIRMPLRAMAARMQGSNTVSDSSTVVNGGFMPDGSIYTPTTGEIETITQDGITISADKSLGEATIECTVVKTSETVTVKWVITLTDVDSNLYTGEAQIVMDMTNAHFSDFVDFVDLDTLKLVVDGKQVENGVANITVDTQAQTITFTTPHFSTIELVGDVKANQGATAGTTITIDVGGTDSIPVNGNTATGIDTSIATVTIEEETTGGADAKNTLVSMNSDGTYTGLLYNGTGYMTLDASGNIGYTTDPTKATEFTVVRTTETGSFVVPYSTTTYTIQAENGKYLAIETSRIGLSVTYSMVAQDESYNWSYDSDENGFYGSRRYITYSDNKWALSSNASNYTALYTYTPGTGGETTNTMTVTGVGEGTTTVTIGGTEYTINVKAREHSENKSLTYNNSLTLDAGLEIVSSNGDDYITISDKTITAREQTGTATVVAVKKNAAGKVIDRYTYTISVTEENLEEADTLTIEYWITNAKVYANGDTDSISMILNAQDAYGENGVLISTLVPANGNKVTGNDVVAYWKTTRLTSENEQTGGSGVDKTLEGNDFAYIRYYNAQWQFSADRTKWYTISSTDQIVAYYLQITDVTVEVTTEVVDWGFYKEKWSELNYLKSKYVLLDYSVKYEDGTESPAIFPTSKTLGFHCETSDTDSSGNYYRRIGSILAVETDRYEVYMITATPTSDKPTTKLSGSTASGNTSYTYDGTEKVVWAESQEVLDNSQMEKYTSISGDFGCTIGGEPTVQGIEIYQQHGMKITYYVRAKITLDSLHVEYYVKGSTDTFHNYDIAVPENTKFDANIGMGTTPNTLVNNEVTNYHGVKQIVNGDLTTMPQIAANYRYAKFELVEVVRSDDGKTVKLYYEFKNTHSFVIDFGLPLKITSGSLGLASGGDWVETNLTWTRKYGEAENVRTPGRPADSYILYTPKSVLGGTEILYLELLNSNGEGITHIIYLIPASTVYYEDTFVKPENGVINGATQGVWEMDGTRDENVYQALTKLGSSDKYGYDAVYAGGTTFSLGAAKKVTVTSNMETGWTDGSSWPTATFQFTGTGFDVISLTSNTSGLITYDVVNAATGEKVMSKFVTNYYGYDYDGENWVSASGDGTNALYQLPVIRVDDLAYGTYTVTITAAYGSFFDSTGKGEYSFWLDGVRVYGTLQDSSIYKDDHEAYPQFIELHDVLSSKGAENYQAVLIEGDSNASLADYIAKGPNHEVYLAPNQSLAFALSGSDKIDKVMIGMKAVKGNAAYAINNGTATTISTATDMYYDVTDVAKAGVVTITNKGTTILSLTTIKVTFTEANQNVTVSLSQAQVQSARMMVRAMYVFTPERLEASWLVSTVRAGQKAILTVKTSEDVEAILVDGQEITSYRTRKNRSGETWREFNWSTTATETTDYAISAVNADGIESDPISVTLTVKAASQRPGLRDWITGILDRLF